MDHMKVRQLKLFLLKKKRKKDKVTFNNNLQH